MHKKGAKKMKKIKIIGVVFFIILMLMNNNVVFAVITYENSGTGYRTIDEYIEDGRNFIDRGKIGTDINNEELKEMSNFLYNLLLGAGIIIAVIIGGFLGIKFMVGSIQEKADIKSALVWYVIGCLVVFGAFGIWKLVMSILTSSLHV